MPKVELKTKLKLFRFVNFGKKISFIFEVSRLEEKTKRVKSYFPVQLFFLSLLILRLARVRQVGTKSTFCGLLDLSTPDF